MRMFLGEYNPNITEGSRISLPKKFREQISSAEVILSKGFEKCIFVYDPQEWSSNVQKQVENLNGSLNKSDLERYLYRFSRKNGNSGKFKRLRWYRHKNSGNRSRGSYRNLGSG